VHNTKAVQVSNTKHDLVNDGLCAFFGQLVGTLSDVVEQILALHVLNHDVVLLARLKQVNQLDDVLVLAHFEHFNLPALLEDFDWLHI